MTSTTFHPRPEALESWSIPSLVTFFMAASENMMICDDGHAPTLEGAGCCPGPDDES